ncbi:hypothetical protein MNBD_GAMMA26-1241 [hydrothermal vent metagenome]|uniref:General secretion pathway GspH domain-containing protein n=1 Tax=hydrothermal vent metagenome TaxID=652676 RepID=A0A3B1B8X8_9ZZZZ
MTLLEILVVLVITASLTSLVILSFSQRSDDQLQEDAQRFAALVEQHCQDAFLLGQIRAISVNDRGYQFWYRAKQQWFAAANNTRLYRQREWSADWDLELRINGLAESLNRELNPAKQQPRLICMADGQLPLFDLHISSQARKISGLRLISAGDKRINIEQSL